MSSYSSTYPAIRPTYQIDFSNGGRIPPNATFSRADSPIDATKAAASAVHFWSNEKHLSSENLLTPSTPDSSWVRARLTPTYSQTGPYTGANATLHTEQAVTNTAYLGSQNYTTVANTSYTYSVWVKQNTGSRNYYQLRVGGLGTGVPFVTYHLSGAGSIDEFGGSYLDSYSITAGPTGWYKLTMTITPTSAATTTYFFLCVAAPSGGEIPSITGDTGNSFLVFGAQVSSTGESVLNETTTSIHRQYASTLKSVSTAGQPRFEYGIDGQSVAKGILVESASTNLITYSNNFGAWGEVRVTAEAASAIGPDGQLCYVMREDTTAANTHYMNLSVNGQSTSTTYTMSVYAKKVATSNQTRHLRLRVNGIGGQASVEYNLANGTVNRTTGTSLDSSSISSVGNGWYRLVMTYTNPSSSVATGMIITGSPDTTATLPTYDGDGYSAFALFGAMVEEGSHASSLITSNSGSQTTRAADSLSVTDSSLFSGNEGTIAFEGQTLGGSTGFGRFWTISDGTNDNRIHVYPTSATVVRFRVYRNNVEQRNVASSVTDVTQSNRYAFAYEDNKLRLAQNGSLITDDSNSAVMPVVDKLSVGINAAANSNSMNGYVKRIAFYNQSLSDTEMASLSS